MISKREYTRLKSRLTRAQNSGDPHRVLAEARYALHIFEEQGYPDTWHLWKMAAYDAETEIRYA